MNHWPLGDRPACAAVVLTYRVPARLVGALGALPLGPLQQRRHRHPGHGRQQPRPRHVVDPHDAPNPSNARSRGQGYFAPTHGC